MKNGGIKRSVPQEKPLLYCGTLKFPRRIVPSVYGMGITIFRINAL